MKHKPTQTDININKAVDAYLNTVTVPYYKIMVGVNSECYTNKPDIKHLKELYA